MADHSSLFEQAERILVHAGALDQARVIRDLREAAEALSSWDGAEARPVVPARLMHALDVALARGNRA